jgi:hypothetical protein
MNHRRNIWGVGLLPIVLLSSGIVWAAGSNARVTVTWHTSGNPAIAVSSDSGARRAEVDTTAATIRLINFPADTETVIDHNTSLSAPTMRYTNLTSSTTQTIRWVSGGNPISVGPGGWVDNPNNCTALCGLLWGD